MANDKSGKQFLNFVNARNKRKHDNYVLDDIEDTIFFSPASADDEIEEQSVSVTAQAVADIVKGQPTKARGPRRARSQLKIFWDRGYNNWRETEFREHMRVDRQTFELILNRISANIYETPTNMEPNLLETHRQLAMTWYRLGHRCSFRVICDLFGVSIGSAVATFNKVLREVNSQPFNEYVHMTTSEEEWIAEYKGFIENYEFRNYRKQFDVWDVNNF